jgi:hypothetical protein
MEPNLPQGSVLLAVEADPEVGDVVVFEASDGRQIVHRVVDQTPEGLITTGDANDVTDQEAGLEPVDPDSVLVVPNAGSPPIALPSALVTPIAIFAIQAVLLTWGLSGIMDDEDETVRGALAHLKPHHFVLTGALVLLIVSPTLQESVDSPGEIQVRGGPVPSCVLAAREDGVSVTRMGPMDTVQIQAEVVDLAPRATNTNVVDDGNAFLNLVVHDPQLSGSTSWEDDAMTVTHADHADATLDVTATKTDGASRFTLHDTSAPSTAARATPSASATTAHTS